jgi:hypothetical protein
MFAKAIVRGLLAAVLAATTLRGTAMADTILPTGLAPGSQYQILFVTSDGTTATSSNIADYNSFVTQETNESPTLAALEATWTALASTPTFSASNASNTTNIPIYDTQGNMLEQNFQGLFTDNTTEGPLYDQNGLASQPYAVWTGIPGVGGGPPSGHQLGTTYPIIGCPDVVPWGQWLDAGYTSSAAQNFPLYALSSPITVVPEPATLTLLGSALLGLGVVYLRRRGAKAILRLLLATAFWPPPFRHRPTCSTCPRARPACNS